jgi:NAD(P)-dependent dehydrogenase (short-subunit alcohol dehydrogenase family)
MSGRLDGKKILVTGAAQGLGAAIASMAAREGARVMLTDLDGAGAAAVSQRINTACGTGTAFARTHDVRSEQQWSDAIAAAADQLDGLSGLVNNAGIVHVGTVEDTSLAQWKNMHAVNLDGTFIGIQRALPVMRRHQPGSIVNISSISGLIASHNLTAYNASKAAVWMLTKSVALHCARQRLNIRCNSIHPAFIDTPILSQLSTQPHPVAGGDPQLNARLVRQIPLGRLGCADDVAYAAVYLLADESQFMTASEIKLDGGISAQ